MEISQIIENFINESFYKIAGITLSIYFLSIIKEWIREYLFRRHLIKEGIVAEDKRVKIGDLEGVIKKVTMSYTKMKTEDYYAYIPNRLLAESLIIQVPVDNMDKENP